MKGAAKMADHTLPAIFIIAFIGGLLSGAICSAVLLFSASAILQNTANQAADIAQAIVQNVNIDCVEEYVPGASYIKLGDQAYYCTLVIKEKGQDFNMSILPN